MDIDRCRDMLVQKWKRIRAKQIKYQKAQLQYLSTCCDRERASNGKTAFNESSPSSSSSQTDLFLSEDIYKDKVKMK